MADKTRPTGTAKDPDPKVEKGKQAVQKNAEKLAQKTDGPKPATGTKTPTKP
jgi:hypothetical protein